MADDTTRPPGIYKDKGANYPGPQPDNGNQGVAGYDRDGAYVKAAPKDMQCIDPAPGGGEFKTIKGLPFVGAKDMV